jgi:hypothetical protein
MPAQVDSLVLVRREERWLFGRVVSAGPPAAARITQDDGGTADVTLQEGAYVPARFPLAEPPPSRESSEQTRHDATGASPLAITNAEARKLVAAYNAQVERLDARGRGGELNMVKALAQVRRRGNVTDQSKQSEETPEARKVEGMTRKQYDKVMDDRAKLQAGAAACPSDRARELAHEIRLWVGQRVSQVFKAAVPGQRAQGRSYVYERYYGTVIGVFLTAARRGPSSRVPRGPTYAIRFEYSRDGPQGSRFVFVDFIRGRAALDETTRDEDAPPPAAGYELVSVDAGAPLAFDWFTNVQSVWAARSAAPIIARCFVPPHQYGRVAKVTEGAVEVAFGVHYAELHGRETRVFTRKEADEAKLKLLLPSEADALGAWVSDAQLREGHNGLVAWYCAGKQELMDRLWLKREDGPSYAEHFEQKRLADGALYAKLWLHRPLLDRMAARPRWAFGDDTELAVAAIVHRMRAAVAYAAEVVPDYVLRTVKGGGVVAPTEEDDGDSDDDEERVSYVGYPHGLYLTWSDMKRAKVKRRKRRCAIVWLTPPLLKRCNAPSRLGGSSGQRSGRRRRWARARWATMARSTTPQGRSTAASCSRIGTRPTTRCTTSRAAACSTTPSCPRSTRASACGGTSSWPSAPSAPARLVKQVSP